jgi:hypothetical protein
MIASRKLSRCLLAVSWIATLGALSTRALGQTKKEEAELLAAPAAELISPEVLAPAVRQAVANGAAALIARMTAEDNPFGLALPPHQTVRIDGYNEVKAKRVTAERPVYEHVAQEMIVPVIVSGKETGRFAKEKRMVSTGKKIGTETFEYLAPDPNGSETMKVPIYAKDGPAMWRAYLPGLNGMALYVLAKAGLGDHPATVKHAAALADHAKADVGLPDLTFDLAWMAAGFAALGPDSPHEKLTRRLYSKLLDGQIREKGDLDGLWGPVCVNFTYFGKLMTVGQMILHELNTVIPKKLETAAPAEQEKIIAVGQQMKEFANIYERTQRDVFRAGTRMLQIKTVYGVGETLVLPGLPFNAYRWVMSDVESTEAAAFAIAVGKEAGVLPRETERGAIKGKKVHAPVKADAALKMAAKRLAAAIDDDGGASSLAFVAENKSLKDTGFPVISLHGEENRPKPQLFDVETACTCVAALDAVESLVAADAALDKQLAEPRQRARDRAAKIAARWFKESANPAADGWKGMYQGLNVSHADLTKSPEVPAPAFKSAVESLPWGPSGCMYRIVPGFRGLFAGEGPKERYKNDLFRQIAYRLVALQDQNGQWSSAGNHLQSTAVESLNINWVAMACHGELEKAGKLAYPDPVSYETLLNRSLGHWMGDGNNDAAVYPTLASLLFLVEAIDKPVSLDGIQILPEAATEAKKEDAGKPDPKRTPVGAAQSVARPSLARTELFGSLVGAKWGAKTPATPVTPKPAPAAPSSGKPDEKPAAVKPKNKEEEEGYDGLDKIEGLLESDEEKE